MRGILLLPCTRLHTRDTKSILIALQAVKHPIYLAKGREKKEREEKSLVKHLPCNKKKNVDII